MFSKHTRKKKQFNVCVYIMFRTICSHNHRGSSYRQNGQELWQSSHRRMHRSWNMCMQGICFTTSPASNDSMQTEQSIGSSSGAATEILTSGKASTAALEADRVPELEAERSIGSSYHCSNSCSNSSRDTTPALRNPAEGKPMMEEGNMSVSSKGAGSGSSSSSSLDEDCWSPKMTTPGLGLAKTTLLPQWKHQMMSPPFTALARLKGKVQPHWQQKYILAAEDMSFPATRQSDVETKNRTPYYELYKPLHINEKAVGVWFG